MEALSPCRWAPPALPAAALSPMARAVCERDGQTARALQLSLEGTFMQWCLEVGLFFFFFM